MILYGTKQTIERYKLPLPDDFAYPEMRAQVKKIIESEEKDDLLRWGAKLFYFDRRKCLEIINFASRLTFFLIDFKMADRRDIGNSIAWYMFDLYAEDPEMTKRCERFFTDHPFTCFARLTDRSMIASLNSAERYFLMNGDILYKYIRGGILHTRELNKDVNREYPVKFGEERNYIFPANKFRELLLERYAEK